jgi:hypothetical protein
MATAAQQAYVDIMRSVEELVKDHSELMTSYVGLLC